MNTLFPSHIDNKQEPSPPKIDCWNLIKSELSQQLDKRSFHEWITPIVAKTEFSELSLLVPDMLFYQVIVSDYLDLIERCKTSLALDNYTIRIGLIQEQTASPLVADDSKNLAPPVSADNDLMALGTDEKKIDELRSPAFAKTLSHTSKLNPTYTLSNFVRGPSNQFALATCQSVAENPGMNYNPLFVYGSTGLGKTHLLHAVGNFVMRTKPGAIVTYISSERFMNEMIYCIRHNRMWDFRQKYRHCDLFMMDDIQFISGNKAATQEEFFHTFNTLYEAKKQIIITSDLFPQDIPDIEERLRNRFQWGLIADIQPPDMEHRVAILINKAEKLNVELSYDVAEYIANHAKRNIRELEGALHRIAAFAALQGRPIDKSLAIDTFQTVMSDSPKQLSVETIQKVVASHFKLRLIDLKSRKRQRILTLPRQIAMYLSRRYTDSSFPEIGDKFGGKDHTTVMHGVKKIERERETDLEVKAHLETLHRALDQTN